MRLSTSSDSSPLIITLRHILIAEATPTRSAAISIEKPSGSSSAASAGASLPPSSIGTRIPYCGTVVITADST